MTGPSRPASVAVILTALLALATPAAASTESTTAPPSASPTASSLIDSSTDRIVSDDRIAESSGLAASLRHQGVLWTHNDSGGQPTLFAVQADGRTAAAVNLSGAEDYDWEAVASFRDTAGQPMLAVADIGDNRAERPSVQILILPEPALEDATVTPSRVLRLQYPSGAVDAETMLVDPDGRRAFIVTKGFGSTVYEVPTAAWTSASVTEATLVRVASVPMLLVTDGVMGPGDHPLLRTYSELAVLPPLTDDNRGGSLHPLADLRLPLQQQGESLTLLDASTALVGSEGHDEPILRIPLPAEFHEVLEPRPAALGLRPEMSSGTPGRSAAPAVPRGSKEIPGAKDTAMGTGPTVAISAASAGLVAGALILLGRRRAGRGGRR